VHEQSIVSNLLLTNRGQTPTKYDYVIYDCFSDSGVPGHILTTEFWADLKKILRADGVLAVNFAGHLKSDAARAIWFTLRHSCGGCRVFHDRIETDDVKRKVAKGMKVKEEKVNYDGRDTFLNMISFCSPTGNSVQPLRRTFWRAGRGITCLDSWWTTKRRRRRLWGICRRERRKLGVDGPRE